jgi:hypothetical protein
MQAAPVLLPVEIDREKRIQVPPVVGDFRAAHPLAVHREVEAPAAGAVRVIEGDASFVQPDLEHTCLKPDLQPTAGHDECAFRHHEPP